MSTLQKTKRRVSLTGTLQKAKKSKEVGHISKKEKYRGLCSTCKNAPMCMYRRGSKQPVLQCEEFEGYAPLSVRTTGRNISPASLENGSSIQGKDSGKYKGLCRNCENRETCTYPKPEGGVWHCNEYL
jgi:hypothetical protein